MARPTKDTINTHNLILHLAKLGLNNKEIADATGLARTTIQNYFKDTDLGKTVKEMRAIAKTFGDEEKSRLNKMAILATKRLLKKRKSVEIREKKDENGKVLSTETITRECEPNASIVQFVLKNTDPNNWSDTQAEQINSTDDKELRIIIDDDTQ